MQKYRYSRWDGSQEVPSLDADSLLHAVTDDLMSFGDLRQALRNLLQRGLQNEQGQRFAGLQELLRRLRQRRRQMLDRYDLTSVIEDIRQRLDEILRIEKSTLRRRLEEAQELLGESPPDEVIAAGPAVTARQEGAGGVEEEGREEGPERQFAEMLKSIIERKQEHLKALPTDVGGQVKALQDYEFMDPEAQHKFQELLEMLRKAMLDTFFKELHRRISDMSPEQMARLKEMVKDLNQMLSEKIAGNEPDFDEFMAKHGDLFEPNPPQSLEELIAQMQQQIGQMQSMLDSLPPDMRQQLQDLLSAKVADPDLLAELNELAGGLELIYPMRSLRSQYPFRGEEGLDIAEAMRLMDYMQSLDELEHQLERVEYGGDINEVDPEQIGRLLGEEAKESFDQLRRFLEVLEEAGYIRQKGRSWELTPRAIRKIGEKALAEVYAQIRAEGTGKHVTHDPGVAGEQGDDTKRYAFGDPMHIHLQKTIMNSLQRERTRPPLRLAAQDFEVYRSEQLSQTATVVMVDLSWSMALRGSFQAAKKVALALNNLISSKFARDSLYVIGFSAYAREVKPEELPYVNWDESVLGTNMHHAFILAQKLLSKHKVGTRQIIMISDGEPTAHLERGRSFFAYPPSPVTIRETLKEVKRCTDKGIVINTFMLDHNYFLKEFVNDMAKINKGRVFYTTPEGLGEYILVDYVAHKRKHMQS
ncbi:MAG TPA: VWA domain-containing protein [Dehalococcoidia bacterium]|nr:VWA domain-containing protein [Dehalococcoidia bacterium]